MNLQTWKPAIRIFKKDVSQSLINLIVLTIGFVCVLIIGAFVYTELSFDKFHENGSRIYRVNYDETTAEIKGSRHLTTVGPTVGPALRETYPAVEEFVRFRYADVHNVRVNEKQFYEEDIYYADPSVFDVFTFPFLHGDGATALGELNSAVITKEFAIKYFGSSDVIGKEIIMDNESVIKITGVLETLPSTSHLRFQMLLPFDAFRVPAGYPVTLNDWGWISFHTYVMLRKGAQPEILEEQLPDLVKKHFEGDRSKKFKYRLQSLSDIYMGDVKHARLPSGNPVYLFSLGIAAALILFASGFNFMNLFTVRSLARTKEMGVRKVSGASKSSIFFALIFESVGYSIAAFTIACVAVVALVPYLGNYFGIRIYLLQEQYLNIVVWASMVVVLIGFIAGLYPAIAAASLSSSSALKGNIRSTIMPARLRNSLVILQFVVSTSVLVAVLVINSQISYLKNKYLGFEKEELMLLRLNEEELARKYPQLREQLLQQPDISMVSVGGHRFDGNNGNVPVYIEGTEEDGLPMSIDAAKYDYFATTGINLIAGREFNERFPTDSAHGVILNEAAVKSLGLNPEDAIGKKIRVGAIVTDGIVTGVVQDYHFGPLHNAITPLAIYYPRTLLEDIYVRIRRGSNPEKLVSSVSQIWATVIPDYPFDYVFLEDEINSHYKNEETFSRLFSAFSIISMLIACLGLYAIVNQEIIYRIKEIGIRKVLGATASSIFKLISGKFFKQVMIAILISWPVAFYALDKWVNSFAYHSPISVQPFFIAAVATGLIALITVLYKTVTASKANPVQSIRNE